MPSLPIRPNLKHYSGAKDSIRRKVNEHNAKLQRIADHLNRLIADNPNEMQQHLYGYIAIDLGVSLQDVQEASPEGGSNGITLRVRPEDRPLMERYRSAKP